jgi:protein-S-isoprenylcysteine O-methyltransferase Ste14
VPLKEELEAQGNWLFSRRSHLPLLAVPLLVLAMRDTPVPGAAWTALCLGVSLGGLLLRCVAIGYAAPNTSGRNMAAQKAESLNTTGPYSVLRHPLYVGNFFMFLGTVAFTRVGWLVGFSIPCFWLYYERMMFAEEEFLRRRFGEGFVAWAQQTPAIVPRLSRWRRPEGSFTWRTVVRGEYRSLFALVAVFTFLELVHNAWADARPLLDSGWLVFFGCGAAAYLALRLVVKRTPWLRPEGA